MTLAADPKGHRLTVADLEDESRSVLLCMRCGAWASTRPRGLTVRCRGRPTQAGALAKRALLAGSLPGARLVKVGPFRPLAADLALAAAASSPR